MGNIVSKTISLMTRKKQYFILTLLILSVPLFAQRKTLSLEEAIIGPYMNFRTDQLSQAQWRPQGHEYTWIADSVFMAEPASAREESYRVFSLSDINRMVSRYDSQAEPYKRFPRVSWLDHDRIVLRGNTGIFVVNVKEDVVEWSFVLPDKMDFGDLTGDGRKVVLHQGANLWWMNDQGEMKQITADTQDGIVNGKSVSRNEFGINKGTFWSPKGRYLAFYQKDESRVTKYPLVDVEARVAKVKEIRYPMAGMSSERISVWIYDTKKDSKVALRISGEPDQYLTNIAWGPEEDHLYVAVLNRDQDHLWLNKYEVGSGRKVKTLFEETHEAYVEPLQPVRFLKNQPDRFIWESRIGGFNQVFLYDTSGKQLENLTPEDADVEQVVGFYGKNRYFAYTSASISPLERHLFVLDRKTGKRIRITKNHGMHQVALSPDGSYFVDRYSNLKTPGITRILDNKGRVNKILLESRDPWQNRKLGKIELGKIPGDQTHPDLFYRLIKPVDFDPSRKYPVIVYVYGGPHSQLVTDSWLGQSRMWQHYMAGKGYVSFTLDNRGTLGRGFEFENVIHRQLGVLEVEDQLRGVAYLKSLPWVDTSRLGVHGWSYGGFMTLSLMLKHPGVFRVAVAGGPVTDWKYYEVMYGERYMDRPEQNPQGYQNADLKNYVSNLEGKCLIIHGAMDSTVVWQHSLTLLRAFVKAGKQVDYFVYPGHPHNVRGMDRIHLMRKVTDYFDTFLME